MRVPLQATHSLSAQTIGLMLASTLHPFHLSQAHPPPLCLYYRYVSLVRSAKQPILPPSEANESPPPPPSRTPSHRLISSISPQEILSSPESVFVKPYIPPGISLRNFGTQVQIYATLADIVLYSPNGSTRAVCDIAERIKEAVENKAIERNGGHAVEAGDNPGEFSNGPLAYNVFVVTDSFDVFERDHPELVAIDGRGNPKYHTDFMAREREEMRQMTQATQICDNIWLGNTADVPVAQNCCSPMEVDPFDWSENPHGWDICIECRDDTNIPHPSRLRLAEEHIAKLDAAWAACCASSPAPSPSGPGSPPLSPTLLSLSNLHVNASPLHGSPCDTNVRARSASPCTFGERRRSVVQKSLRRSSMPPIQPRPPPHPNSIIHLTFPSSPTYATAKILNVLEFIARYADPDSFFSNPISLSSASSPKRRGSLSSSLSSNVPTYHYQPPGPSLSTRPLRILLHSLDGYTETSVLALSYLMRAKRYSLPEAYLELQIERSRSFFVCPGDLEVLGRVESALGSADNERRREEKVARREKERAAGTATSTPRTQNDESGPKSTGSATSISHQHSNSMPGARWGRWSGPWRTGGLGPVVGNNPHSTVSQSSPTAEVLASQTGSKTPQQVHQRARALTSPVSMPSRMNHNAWFTDLRFDGSFPSRVLPHLYLGNLNHASNAYMLHALGITHVVSVGRVNCGPQLVVNAGPNHQGSLWMEEREGRIKVLDIKGVSDDGIDSLRPQFALICDWIEKARLEGGKVLVHCRVGVSRSATVTIAYVMKHHEMSLVDAYLLVRSRRLSILIQPNMRLLYNLVGWEIELAKEAAGTKGTKPELTAGTRLNWPYLAREVHRLNERYLH
ncbi:hypothetical protein BS47DRAFT_1376479 [Hydnum rufescens UP504]|uniref:Protein-tyrosine-phosphatase n=1 Tax=Hydnum rufescens UP504 TaxID=1448309 RepID=A0A9P6B1G8_9AGAM|nr:hypothetical protein BS47DRAFT_1376479 [Hydnum rufescens UP504]